MAVEMTCLDSVADDVPDWRSKMIANMLGRSGTFRWDAKQHAQPSAKQYASHHANVAHTLSAHLPAQGAVAWI